MDEKKKVKYVQKRLFEPKKQEKAPENLQNSLNQSQKPQKAKWVEKGVDQTSVVNVKVEYLRKSGYKDLLQWLSDPSHVYIGRHNHYVPGATGSIWANPFKVDKYGRDGCIQKFKEYLLQSKELMGRVRELKGKVLGCWCAPERCHGHVLAEIANSLP